MVQTYVAKFFVKNIPKDAKENKIGFWQVSKKQVNRIKFWLFVPFVEQIILIIYEIYAPSVLNMGRN